MTLLAERLPEFDKELSQAVFIAQPPSVVFRAVHEVRVSEMPLATFFNKLRTLFGRPAGTNDEDLPLWQANERVGWVPLGEIPDREIVAGLVGQFWKADVGIDHIAPEEFATEPPPDRVKIAVDYLLEPVEGGTKLSMNTRIREPRDPAAARKFHLYSTFIRIGIALTVGSGLRAIKRRAERAQA